MENKNNNFANQKISFFPLLFLPPPLKEKHNLLENYNIIHYNGVTMPRISLYSPFFINTFATPIVKNGFNRAINTNTNTSKDPELELKEKENKKSEIGNDFSNCFKMSNVNELNLHEGKNNVNNYNLIEQGKNCNFLKSIDIINNIGKINQQKMLINNYIIKVIIIIKEYFTIIMILLIVSVIVQLILKFLRIILLLVLKRFKINPMKINL